MAVHNCEVAKFVDISFFVPEGSNNQLMHPKLISDGNINGLEELGISSSSQQLCMPCMHEVFCFGGLGQLLTMRVV